MPRIIALYLPQYHPIPENDEWWGKGFTEWVNVARAKPLFRGHRQPRIPEELGFYDLRCAEVRERQARLAKEAGIEAFCYYDYWFGAGKRLLERPLQEVVSSKQPDFPFCISWANGSWYNKKWDPKAPNKDKLLIEQQYLGQQDYTDHFLSLLECFKDPRYLRVGDKLFFMVCEGMELADAAAFIKCWRRLAHEHGLGDFYFTTITSERQHYQELLQKGFDAIIQNDLKAIYRRLPRPYRALHFFMRKLRRLPLIYPYKKAIRYMVSEECREEHFIPCIYPNWDHSPRSRRKAFILSGSTPALFGKLARRAIDIVKDKAADKQIIILKSWNEWGEGNYMEPDREWGRGYIDALRDATQHTTKNN